MCMKWTYAAEVAEVAEVAEAGLAEEALPEEKFVAAEDPVE